MIHHQGFLSSWMLLGLLLVNPNAVHGQTVVEITSPSGNKILETGSLTLLCEITNYESQPSNRALVWKKDGDFLSWNSELQGEYASRSISIAIQKDGSKTLYFAFIDGVKPEDDGTYKCIVARGTIANNYDVLYDHKVLSVIRPYPVCSPTTGERYYVQNTVVEFTCTVESIVPFNYPNLFWRRLDTSEITFGDHDESEFERTSELQFTVSQDHDEATYECSSTGNNVRTCTVGPIQVIPGLPVISPESLTVYDGHEAEFSCNIPNAESAMIEFYTIPPTPVLRTISLSENTYTIPRTRLEEDNGKTVVCKATVGDDILEDTATLVIEPSPTTITTTTVLPTTTVKTTTGKPTTTLSTTVRTTTTSGPTTTKTTARPSTTTRQTTTTKSPTTTVKKTNSPVPIPTTKRPVPTPDASTSKQLTDSQRTMTTGNASTTDVTKTLIPQKTVYPKESNDLLLYISVAAGGGAFLIILAIVIIIAAVCCCSCCNADSKGTDETGTTTQGSGSSYSSYEHENRVPIPDIPLSMMDGSVRSSTTSHLSDTMRALPGGYRGTPRQQVRHHNYTPPGSFQGYDGFDTPNGSINGYDPMMTPPGSDYHGHMTPQGSLQGSLSRYPPNMSRQSSFQSYHGGSINDHFDPAMGSTSSMEDFRGHMTPNGSFHGYPGHMTPLGSQRGYPIKKEPLARSVSDYGRQKFQQPSRAPSRQSSLRDYPSGPPMDYPSDTMAGFPGGKFEHNNNNQVPVKENYRVREIKKEEVQPKIPIRRESSRKSNSSKKSTKSSKKANSTKRESRQALIQQDSGFHEEISRSRGSDRRGPQQDIQLTGPGGNFGDYSHTDHMLF